MNQELYIAIVNGVSTCLRNVYTWGSDVNLSFWRIWIIFSVLHHSDIEGHKIFTFVSKDENQVLNELIVPL